MLEEAEWQTEVATQGIFTAKIQTAASLTASVVDTENNDHRPWWRKRVPFKKDFFLTFLHLGPRKLSGTFSWL